MESDSNLFENLTSKTLSTVSATNIDALTRDVHIEKTNQEALFATVLVNEATMRDGSFIPGTGNIVSTDAITDNGTTVVVFQPADGEVWQVIAMSQTPVGSGSHRTIGALYDGTASVELWDNTASGTAEQLEYSEPLFIDSSMYLRYTVVTVDTSILLKAAMFRVR